MSSLIEVYKNFELVTIDPAFSRFVWRRRFCGPGDFQLITSFKPELFEYFALGNVVYKRDVDEAAFVESRYVVQALTGEMRLVVRGRFLSSILDRRVVSINGSFGLPTLLSNLVNNNFLAGAGGLRSMAPGVRAYAF